MIGGEGDDYYVLDSRVDVVVEQMGQGTDVLFVTFGMTLAANLEYLVLEGSAAINGTGNALGNGLFGNDAANILTGYAGDDGLLGNGGADILLGGEGDDYLEGGAGADTMTGGVGADDFSFRAFGDSPLVGMRDVITDFSVGDFIDLSEIDARVSTTDNGFNDAFHYIGSAAFSGAGQLRFASGVLSGDVNGDKVPDFAIVLTGVTALNWDWLSA